MVTTFRSASVLYQCIHHLFLYAKQVTPTLFNDVFTAYFLYAKQLTIHTPQPTLFNDVFITYFLYAKQLTIPLNQPFLMAYSPLIFCTRGCDRYRHYNSLTSPSVRTAW